MHPNMTECYSGGLAYEYTLEKNNFGIVEVDGDSTSVSTGREFDLLKTALSRYPAPTGNGGADSTTHAVECPSSKSGWQVDPSMIPSMPEEAQEYMEDGAGEGPGLSGDGSQARPDTGTARESVASGIASPTSDSNQSEEGGDDDDAGMTLQANIGALYVSGVALAFTLVGTLLL
jgi:1,3-beta-glucanosyltransferase GAS5